MGEGRLNSDESQTNQRLTVPQAAAALGITEGAVRGRVKRGSLRSYREAGTVYVLLEGGQASANRDEPSAAPGEQSQLVAVLREQLAAEREANRENRRIIAGLIERMPPQLEAPRETPGAPETVEEAPEGASPRSGTGGTHEPEQRPQPRPWWRRVLGGRS